jgi:hypothetical protein
MIGAVITSILGIILLHFSPFISSSNFPNKKTLNNNKDFDKLSTTTTTSTTPKDSVNSDDTELTSIAISQQQLVHKQKGDVNNNIHIRPFAVIDDILADEIIEQDTAASAAANFDETKNQDNLETNKEILTQTSTFHLHDFIANACCILSNPVFLFIALTVTFETFLLKGFSSYLSKYIEYQYRLPASTATMIVGTMAFISLIGGVLIGAFLIKHFKWHLKECCQFIVTIFFITTFLFLGLLIHCPQEDYINKDNEFYSTSGCNCDKNIFYPLCYKKEYLFQSPCHAGCENRSDWNTYDNCSVLYSLLLNNSLVNSTTNDIKLNACDRPASHCMNNLIVVIIFGFSYLFLSSLAALPLLRIVLESVNSTNQAFALGIKSFITKLFGNIPGPLVFATVVDNTCIQWIRNAATGNRACRLYNNSRFSFGLGTLGSSLRLMSAIFAFITLMFIIKENNKQKKRKVSFSLSTPNVDLDENNNSHEIIKEKQLNNEGFYDENLN